MKAKAMKRKTLGVAAALMLAVGALGLAPAHDAAAGTIKIFKSTDGKVVLICHYSDSGALRYCDVATPK